MSLISHCQTLPDQRVCRWRPQLGLYCWCDQFCISLWMEAFDLPTARWFEQQLPNHSFHGLKASILCLNHSSSCNGYEWRGYLCQEQELQHSIIYTSPLPPEECPLSRSHPSSTGASAWTARARPQNTTRSTLDILAQGLPWMSK